MILKTYTFFLLTLVVGILSYDLNDLSTLGQQITEDVNRQLAPLQDLGARITASVQQNLQPIQRKAYYSAPYTNIIASHSSSIWNTHNSFPPAQNLRTRTSVNVGEREQPAPERASSKFAYSSSYNPTFGLGLENLGQSIQQSVYQGLEPVRALEITAKMKGGVGGITIKRHLPQDKKFLVHNYQIFTCNGSISDTTGQCDGTLIPFKIEEKSDYCYNTNSYSIVNNQICIGANLVSVTNNVIKCESTTGIPALLLTIEEFNKLCHGLSETVEYKYIADPNDFMHVEIPNANKYVKCTNNQPGTCIFRESHVLPHQTGVFVGNNIGMFQSSSIRL